MATQKIKKTYDENGVTVTVYETVRPRRRKIVISLPVFVCTHDYAEISNDKVARLSMSHRANGRGN